MRSFSIQQAGLSFVFLDSGDLFEIRYQDILVNQLHGNSRDGSLNNLFLRIHQEGKTKVYPLLGVKSNAVARQRTDGMCVCGAAGGLSYKVDFWLTGQKIWFWDVRIWGMDGERIDLVYGQDLGLATLGAVLDNEAYVSQYLDHTAFFDSEHGYVVCTRQNRDQGGYPYLQQGALTKALSYCTDGFQFFGLKYKETNQPQALYEEALPSEVYQHEFAYTGLQSKGIAFDGGRRFIFYGLFCPDHPGAIQELEYRDSVKQAWREIRLRTSLNGQAAQSEGVVRDKALLLRTQEFSPKRLDSLFPRRIHEEWQGNTLLSFFTPEHHHVVLKAKELRTERPHGLILTSGNNAKVTLDVISTTVYMFGIFNSQVAIGNTTFNRLLSNNRNQLNVFKTSGQRLYVEIEGEWRLFALPSLFEMGFNYARWYYQTAGETFVIATYTVLDAPEIRISVDTLSGTRYRYRLTNQVIMDQFEYGAAPQICYKEHTLIFKAGEDALSKKAYPHLNYALQASLEFTWWQEPEASLVILETPATACVEFTLTGGLLKYEPKLGLAPVQRDLRWEIARYDSFLREVMGGFALTGPEELRRRLDKFNTLAWWYTQNMLVHFTAPRGLEQSSGGAWGTRDVCQGPAEYFLATQNYGAVREILLTVYAHQYWEDGNWAQWFMYDQYRQIQAGESHGDVAIWPLKLLSDYLKASADFAILHMEIPFTKRDSKQFTEHKFALLEHVYKQLDYLQSTFLHDTYLPAYGDGDWDDTLQPANPQLRQHMVSSWTTALLYQTINAFAGIVGAEKPDLSVKLGTLAGQIKSDFERYVLRTNVIPGFVYLEDLENPNYMLHPSDTKTKIQYRLLPLTRSIIAELVDAEQARKNAALIEEHLSFPDGVRLMNRPAAYHGGVSVHFQRAEQAANFGREVGLQYVHAHIRYVEAMAKLGKAAAAWQGLEVVNPITLADVVPNAELRQSNTYFSSSDGKFPDRYAAATNFEKLRSGAVPVKGGWRIYSSGPGIYFNQLVASCLGIRFEGDDLVIDPVLPSEFNGLQFSYRIFGKPIRFTFHLRGGGKGVVINKQQVNCTAMVNPYRPAGFLIKGNDLHKLLRAENEADVFVQAEKGE